MVQPLESRSVLSVPSGVEIMDPIITSGNTAFRVRVYTPLLRRSASLPVPVYLHGSRL